MEKAARDQAHLKVSVAVDKSMPQQVYPWRDCGSWIRLHLEQNNKESCDGLVPAGNQAPTQPLSEFSSSMGQGKKRKNRNEKHFGSKRRCEYHLAITIVGKTDLILAKLIS
ncbi:mucin-2 [Grus japonensis]|uniref:Mucin-2 n=1 Tax=Grus japonensis TaxID=30415 RepID=A0ABC9WDB9_GRUJA